MSRWLFVFLLGCAYYPMLCFYYVAWIWYTSVKTQSIEIDLGANQRWLSK